MATELKPTGLEDSRVSSIEGTSAPEKISPVPSYDDTTAKDVSDVKYNNTDVEEKDFGLENGSSEEGDGTNKSSASRKLWMKYKVFAYVFFELLMTAYVVLSRKCETFLTIDAVGGLLALSSIDLTTDG